MVVNDNARNLVRHIQGVSRISEQNDHAIRSLLDQSLQLRDQAGSLNRQLTQFKD